MKPRTAFVAVSGLSVCGALLGTLCVALCAHAQNDPFGSGLGGGGDTTPGRSPGGGQKTSGSPSGGGAAPPGMPELHAASGGGDSLVPPGSEPSLPDNPLEVSEATARFIGSDAPLDELDIGRGQTTERSFYGIYEESSGDYRFRTLFPFWLERTQPSAGAEATVDRASLYGGLYYNRRSAGHADDILFPLVWNLRDPESRTTVVGPFVNRRAPGETDDWFAPLYFTGDRADGDYLIIPPLLTYMNHDADGGLNLFGPVFCSWSGGAGCSSDTASDIDFGLAPLYFGGHDQKQNYTLIPPLLHYSEQSLTDEATLDIWGPYYREHRSDRDMLHLMPLYWSIWGEDEHHTTLLPFFHYGWKGNETLFVNPLYLTHHSEEGADTFITYLYARHRGRTELDMYTPLFWHYEDPDISLDEKLLFPFWYHLTSPREEHHVVFPFWSHEVRYGISETTWITPFFRHSTDLRGWSTAINPLFYIGRDGHDTHTVVAPFFWDFATRESRATVGFPLYWRFSDADGTSQLVGNVYYQEKRVKNGLDWQIHLFPAFSYGETPDGHWWNVLFGLAGYTRRGAHSEVRTLWIPIETSSD